MKKYKGFTLTELAIVIVIISIMGAVIGKLFTFNLPNYQYMIEANRIVIESNLIRKNLESDILSSDKIIPGSGGTVILELRNKNRKITYTKINSRLFRTEMFEKKESKVLLSENISEINFEDKGEYIIFLANLAKLTSSTSGKKFGGSLVNLKIYKRK